MNLAHDPKSGLWYRPDAGELHIIKEQALYGGMDLAGRIVMDIGANIGAFADFALKQGALEVFCFEPFLPTYAVLEKNRQPGMQIFPYGIAAKDGTVDFYLSPRFPAAHTMVPTKNREKVTINVTSFQQRLEAYHPTALKIDCEGAEYDFLTEPLPDYVQEIGMELHFGSKEKNRGALRVLKLFLDWNCVRPFRMNWSTTMLIASRKQKGIYTVRERLRELKYDV